MASISLGNTAVRLRMIAGLRWLILPGVWIVGCTSASLERGGQEAAYSKTGPSPSVLSMAYCTYRSADGDVGTAGLIGQECVTTAAVQLPEGGCHPFPTLSPPTAYPMVDLGPGTVLRVAHVESWAGPIDPSGDIVFADVVSGSAHGRRVVIGSLCRPTANGPPGVWLENPQLGVPQDAGQHIRPLTTAGVGVFYYPAGTPDDALQPPTP